jgi:long-chain acyl-CoA synthetase
MSDEARNVLPESVDKIAHARSMATRPWEDRLVAFRNIGALLVERVRQHPGKNWLTFQDENDVKSCLTYGEFYDLACRTASLMRDRLGIDSGDRVATLLVNDPRTVLIYFAAWMLGATVVPVNIGEDDGRVEFILHNSEAKAAFALPEQLARIESMRANLPKLASTVRVDTSAPLNSYASPLRPQNWGLGGQALDFDIAIAECSPLEQFPNVPSDAECLIVYTSGTTGAPKGVVLEQYNLLADARSIAEWHRFGPSDRAMCVLPIHHVNGTVVTLVTPLYSGGSVVLNRKFRAQAFWRTLADEKCTWVSVVPTVLAFLCERHDDLGQFDLSKFRHIICGAGPLTTELAARFHECFHVRVVHGYGLSETTCYSCFLPIDLGEKEYLSWMTERGFPSIGCPVLANEMAVQDSSGNPLGENERGEIVVRGHNVMKFYFQRPDANHDCFSHGWFRSGDEGFYQLGPDGRQYFFITGRLKELIIRGGVNYSPFDIDEVLCGIPGIKAGMAVGFENNFYGEEIGAYVQLEEGATVTADDIIAACRAKLPYSKSPKVVIFGDTFPVTSTGKYQRLQLKPLFAPWKDAEFREKKGA